MNFPFRQAIAAALLLLSASTLCLAQGGQESQRMQARSVKIASTTMFYRLFVPAGYVATKKYPIVVSLHGIGERGSDNRIQVDREDLAHPWIEDSIQARVPHFIMVPQCPANLTWSASTGGALSETGKGIIDALDSLKREFSLDTNRFYVTGLSLGGAGTYHLLAVKPGYFAAAAPTAAGGDTSAILNIAKTPTWHFHGSLDGNPPAGRRMSTALENRGIKVVRFVSQAAITTPGPTAYRDALARGTPAVDLVAKSPTGISYDSLRKAVEGGADHLYSELTGGDHRSGWMIAWHHPLLAAWMFSNVRGSTPVTLAPKAPAAHGERNKAALIFGALPDGAGLRIFSLDGRRFPSRALVTGTQGRILLAQPAPASGR
jgi:predicted peptidase